MRDLLFAASVVLGGAAITVIVWLVVHAALGEWR